MFGILGHQYENYVSGVTDKAHEFLGAHLIEYFGYEGVRFCVYAPHAERVYVAGDGNNWDEYKNLLEKNAYGFHTGFLPEFKEHHRYKYILHTRSGERIWKTDPFGFLTTQTREHESVVFNLEGFHWHDQEYLEKRKKTDFKKEAMSIYEVSLSSWRRKGNDFYHFDQFVEELLPYVKDMGFTHIEVLPITEHPFDGSWGYQQTGYYSISSRYGDARSFMHFVDKAHEMGLGVIMDWVPCHYPKDSFGLYYFDGEALYESENWEKAYNKQWDTMNFDYSKHHVRNFFYSNARFLADYFHIDGIRVDAVAYMIHERFGDEFQEASYNHDAIEFLKINNDLLKKNTDLILMAEESSAFYGVTKETSEGGLGFHYKWNMGWMNDTLRYMTTPSLARRNHHDKLTFPMMYAFTENFILPLSHDEVVHMKKSLIEKMPGSYHEKFAQLRLLLLYQFTQPGKKLLFMGGEFGQFDEWNEFRSLDWHLLAYPMHQQMLYYTRMLNSFYRSEPALYQIEDSWDGFEWLEVENAEQGILIYKRKSIEGRSLIIALNFSDQVIFDYALQAKATKLKVLFHTGFQSFGGEVPPFEYYDCYEEQCKIGLSPYSGVVMEEIND